VAQLAGRECLPLIQPLNPHERDVITTIQGWAPDVIVVAAYGHILRPALLHIPPKGCLNVHASLLPKYRGCNPVSAAILAGEEETGVTIMLLDEGMDTGPILSQRVVPIVDQDTAGGLTDKLADAGAELLAETLPAWYEGKIPPQPQNEAAATYTQKLCKEDGRIDWSQPAEKIWRMVRAFQPWPGAYTFYHGRQLKILEALPAEAPASKDDMSVPGKVIEYAGGPAVVAGAGVLVLKKVQLAGKSPAEAKSFARGQRVFLGSVLG